MNLLDRFVQETGERDTVSGPFDNESTRMLRIDVDGGVWLKPGAAIAHRGDMMLGCAPG